MSLNFRGGQGDDYFCAEVESLASGALSASGSLLLRCLAPSIHVRPSPLSCNLGNVCTHLPSASSVCNTFSGSMVDIQ